MKDFSENDLVMVRIEGFGGYTNTWWRVRFIDNDGTFIGELERRDRIMCEDYEIGEHVELETEDVQAVYQEGDQFCYGDQVTICDCKALCRNK